MLIYCDFGGGNLNTINERIQTIINELKMTKTEFANKVNVTQQYISKIVKKGNPSDMFIDSVCTKFNINEEWLRTGIGDMFNVVFKEDEYTRYAMEIGMGEHEFIQRAIIKYGKLSDANKKIIDEFLDSLLNDK